VVFVCELVPVHIKGPCQLTYTRSEQRNVLTPFLFLTHFR